MNCVHVVCSVLSPSFLFHCFSSALASPEFEGREGEGLGQHLAHQLMEAYSHPSALDRGSLSIVPGQQCWVLNVDVLVSVFVWICGPILAL